MPNLLMPGVIEYIPLETHVEPHDFDSKLMTLIATTDLYFGPSTRSAGEFIWSFPLDEADRASGGICAYTGFWAAGHSLVTVDGLRYIKDFAPRPTPATNKPDRWRRNNP